MGGGAGGDHQAVEGELAVGGGQHAVAQSLGGGAEHQADVQGLQVGVDDRGVGVAEQDRLRERRAVVGPMGLLADEGDPPLVPVGPQGLDTPDAGQPGPHHHDVIHE